MSDFRESPGTPRRVLLDSYPSSDSLLDELLGEIKRSTTVSLASSPPSSDCESELPVKPATTDVSSMSLAELRVVCASVSQEVECVSSLLVRLLEVRDSRTAKHAKFLSKLTAILRDYASRNTRLNSELEFSFNPTPGNYQKWLAAWKVLCRLPKGIPKHWRKTLWVNLAEQGTAALEWDDILKTSFSDHCMPGDETLGSQIVKDLHRTGNTGFSTEEEHAVLKRVLLAYARFNKSTGYCQGFNIMAALILKVVDFDEHSALKVMVYLIDYVLPENYFAQNLYALSADMAAFRDLLPRFLPELSAHINELQQNASGKIRKSYSSDSPPDISSVHAYEPPLADVFSMQWFLTMFATSLPRKASRRVWDAIFLDGSETLLYTGIAVMAVIERELLQTHTAADFYAAMAQGGERLRKAQLMPSDEFVQILYAAQDGSSEQVPSIKKLREKYTFNIYALAGPDDSEPNKAGRLCPAPSRGGSFAFEKKRPIVAAEEACEDNMAANVDGCSSVREQIRVLTDHYNHSAKQPASIKCNLKLVPPKARAVCPQTSKSVDITPQGIAYAADVPLNVIEQSRLLSGYSTLELLQKHRKKTFTISYSQDSNMRMVGAGMLHSTLS